MNNVFRNLTLQNYNELLFAFSNSKALFWNEEENRLTHAGEYGVHREDIIKKFIRSYIPERFGIGSGFIINSSGQTSTQCDIVIFDKFKTPRIDNHENQRFYPIETVLGIGEVKSNINSIPILNQILSKLSKFKELRSGINYKPNFYERPPKSQEFDIKHNPYDNLFTFVICNKLPNNFTTDKIDYNEIPQNNWHNMILSLEDGLLNYENPIYDSMSSISFLKTLMFKHNFLPRDKKELPTSISEFLSSLNNLINLSSLIIPDMKYYLFEKDDIVD